MEELSSEPQRCSGSLRDRRPHTRQLLGHPELSEGGGSQLLLSQRVVMAFTSSACPRGTTTRLARPEAPGRFVTHISRH